MRRVFNRLVMEMEAGNDTMLVTITSVKGSAPRGKGALMLVGREGLLAGTVGGGIAEAKAIQLGADLIKEKRSGVSDFELNRGMGEKVNP